MKKIIHFSIPSDYGTPDEVYIQQVNFHVLNEIVFYCYITKDLITSNSAVAVFKVKRKEPRSEIKVPVKADTEIFAVN